jgi:hypothetical protein
MVYRRQNWTGSFGEKCGEMNPGPYSPYTSHCTDCAIPVRVSINVRLLVRVTSAGPLLLAGVHKVEFVDYKVYFLKIIRK